MNVKVITVSPFPFGSVQSNRILSMCNGLSVNGMNVEVIVAQPTENKNKIINSKPKGTINNFKYRYISNKNIRKTNLFVRKLYDFFCYLKVYFFIFLNKRNIDFIIIMGPSLDFRSIIPFITKILKIKSIVEINEIPFFDSKNGIISKLKRFIYFKFICSFYDGFIVISNELEKLIKNKCHSHNILKVPILSADSNIFCSTDKPLFNSKYIIHSGSYFESKDGIHGILKAFKNVTKLNDEIFLIMTGKFENSKSSRKILELIDDYKITDKVIFTGYLDEEKLSNYLFYASLAIINKHNNLQNKYCFSTKISDYIKHNVPLILSYVGEVKNYFIHEYNCLFYQDNDIDDLSALILDLLENEEKAKSISKNAKNLILNEFSETTNGKNIHNFLKKINAK